ncbi:uncharacterized protein LOC132257765 [Phlebotomus argentipes]|uniref:uncharacterized protein LOC132257765 n=1 Tax=Phlebotomus argentipes TaxID=94469 RepID=UPI002892E9B9|nr:uncharacterized protein LOC132257765 [Phlebotomus argentipes]
MSNSNLTTAELELKYGIYVDKGFGFVTEVPTREFLASFEAIPAEDEEEEAVIYAVILEPVAYLYVEFLKSKLKFGSCVEKEMYKNMKVETFVKRLLMKKCPIFGKNAGNTAIKAIGSDEEKPLLLMRDYLTCDEVKLASFVTISSGSENRATIAVCSPQLDRKELLDYQDIVISERQNRKDNGYGVKPKKFSTSSVEALFYNRQMWCQFYKSRSLLYKHFDITQKRAFSTESRFVRDERTRNLFDSLILSRKYAIMIDTILFESEKRAERMGKDAHLFVIKKDLQTNWLDKVFMETFDKRVMMICWSPVRHLKRINFIGLPEEGFMQNNGIVNVELLGYSSLYNNHPEKGIRICFAEKEGNIDTDDKVMAIRVYFENNWMEEKCVANNLRIASNRFGVLPVSDYVSRRRETLQ